MASDDSDLAGAPLGAARVRKREGRSCFQRLLGPHRIVFRRPPLRNRRLFERAVSSRTLPLPTLLRE